MSKLGLNFLSGQTLKAEELNMMVSSINENTERSMSNSNVIETLKDKDIDISESDFERLKASGGLDPNKNYYVYEE
jgi:hypothetical protein